MVTELENPIDIGDEIARIHEATHFLYGYAKAENAEDNIEDIQNQINILIAEIEQSGLAEALDLKKQIVDRFVSRRGQKITLEMEEEVRDLIDQLDKMAREVVESKAA